MSLPMTIWIMLGIAAVVLGCAFLYIEWDFQKARHKAYEEFSNYLDTIEDQQRDRERERTNNGSQKP